MKLEIYFEEGKDFPWRTKYSKDIPTNPLAISINLGRVIERSTKTYYELLNSIKTDLSTCLEPIELVSYNMSPELHAATEFGFEQLVNSNRLSKRNERIILESLNMAL